MWTEIEVRGSVLGDLERRRGIARRPEANGSSLRISENSDYTAAETSTAAGGSGKPEDLATARALRGPGGLARGSSMILRKMPARRASRGAPVLVNREWDPFVPFDLCSSLEKAFRTGSLGFPAARPGPSNFDLVEIFADQLG